MKKNIKLEKYYKCETHVERNLIEKFMQCQKQRSRTFLPLLRPCIMYA